MATYFECKVKYDRTLETGAQKTVTEPYLIDALSFTEAEARITEEMRPYTTGEFAVTAVKRVKYDDIFFHQGGDRWYKVKINMITIDEKPLPRSAQPATRSCRPANLRRHLTFSLRTCAAQCLTMKLPLSTRPH